MKWNDPVYRLYYVERYLKELSETGLKRFLAEFLDNEDLVQLIMSSTPYQQKEMCRIIKKLTHPHHIPDFSHPAPRQ